MLGRRYVVVLNGRVLQLRAKVVGFHFETSGMAWMRLACAATKLRRPEARRLARELGAVVMPNVGARRSILRRAA